MRELIAFGRGSAYLAALHRHSRALYREQLRFGHRSGLEAGIAEVAMALGIVAVLALGAQLLSSGPILFASYPPAIVLAGYAFIPLLEVSTPLRRLGQIRTAPPPGPADRP